jgi:hypothetical protein
MLSANFEACQTSIAGQPATASSEETETERNPLSPVHRRSMGSAGRIVLTTPPMHVRHYDEQRKPQQQNPTCLLKRRRESYASDDGWIPAKKDGAEMAMVGWT